MGNRDDTRTHRSACLEGAIRCQITVMTSWVGGDGMDKDYPGEPMIFETLLEGAEIPFWSIMDLGPRRYPTQSRARSSHSHIVEALSGWQEILTPAPEFGE